MPKRSRRQQQSATTGGRLVTLGLLTLYTLLSAYLTFLILTYNFLNFRYLNLVVIGIVVAVFLLALGLFVTGRGKWQSRLLLLLATVLVGGGLFFARSAIDFSDKLNQTASFSQVELSIVVANVSPLTDISQVSHIQVASNDAANTEKILSDLTATQQLSPNKEEVASYQEAYHNILADGQKAMVLNTAYLGLLEAEDAKVMSKIRSLYTMTVKKEVAKPNPIADGDVFNLYISGIDSYGPISGVSRSDVNIIMTVNRKTNKILLTTTPRDAYVPIAGGGQGQGDKLTHAGIYGVESSIGTLENLYGIDINYYARLNFTSFVQLIDLVGGIEVENDQAFTVEGVQHFPAGTIHLTSEAALAFVRERYSLQHGDADRGKNQMKVIAGLVKKLTSISSLTTFTGLIEQLSSSVQTDMPLATMMDVVNDQLQAHSQYQVTSQAVTGTGSTGELPSYAMPGSALYMVSLDENSLVQAKQAIKDVMEGR